jgi:hypothetical protein
MDEPADDPQSQAASRSMIRVEFFDAGTTFKIYPFQDTPGMDLGYWRELDMEYDSTQDRTEEMRNLILGVEHPMNYRPWPRPWPGYLWLDWSRNLYGDIDGPQFEIYEKDDFTGDFSIVPSARAEVYDETVQGIDLLNDLHNLRMSDNLGQDEVRDSLEDPTAEPWLRLETLNESGQPQLKNPIVMLHDGHEAAEFALTVNYGPEYQIVDMREKDWYSFINSDGDPIDEEIGYRHCLLHNDAFYKIYLAPAKWRMDVFVLAHYYYVSYFESFGVDLPFFKGFWTRPAVYPQRNDVCRTRFQESVNWLGVDYSYDEGVDGAYQTSRGAADLAHQIIDAQWYTLSEAFLYLFNDPALITVEQYPPNVGDIVMGVGRVDTVTGEEQIIWVVQKKDIYDIHPRQVIGQFFVPWVVAA